MPIYEGSRYSLSGVVQGITVDNESIRYNELISTTDDDVEGRSQYVTKAGDTFESLAFRFYGDANKWWTLANANSQVFWPLDLQAGVEINVPSVIKVALL